MVHCHSFLGHLNRTCASVKVINDTCANFKLESLEVKMSGVKKGLRFSS